MKIEILYIPLTLLHSLNVSTSIVLITIRTIREAFDTI